ncbi:MAG: glycosyltransferase family 4 protein [Anaerolineae bacterium]|nr:glycosyltransferase family 4 protein [Phycisphaerae bacterium]
MNVVICWSHISGYAAACWRALIERTAGTDVNVQLMAWESNSAGSNIAFDPQLVAGLPIRLLSRSEISNYELIRDHVTSFKPDVVVVPGWMHEPYIRLAKSPELSRAKKIMYVDTPWRGTWRQRMARLQIGSYVDMLDGVIVAGERAFQFMRHLKIPERKIYRGTYGIDFAAMQRAFDGRAQQPAWPRKFLFMGRYHPDKGIDVLLAGYRRYRERITDAWPLSCCGMGPMADQVKSTAGVTDHGFVDPRRTADVMQEHGAFVLASAYDPWPLVIVEACAAGLPVIHSEACGSAVELVRPYYNGIGVATGDADAIARAMLWCHEHVERLPEMGRRGRALAAAYAAPVWAKRWLAMFDEVTAL